MNKRELCENSLSFAYYSAFNGLEIKCINRGIRDEIYAISNAWSGKKKYHKLRIYTNSKGEYIRLYGHTCYLHNFIKI